MPISTRYLQSVIFTLENALLTCLLSTHLYRKYYLTISSLSSSLVGGRHVTLVGGRHVTLVRGRHVTLVGGRHVTLVGDRHVTLVGGRHVTSIIQFMSTSVQSMSKLLANCKHVDN